MSTMATNTQPRRQRRRFTEEFRAGAGRLVFDEGQVALKILPEAFATDPDRLAKAERALAIKGASGRLEARMEVTNASVPRGA